MAKKHIIQGPDGIKHIIEAPDDATPGQIVAFAEQQFSGGAAQPQPQPQLQPRQQGWLEWGKEMVQGKQDPNFQGTKSVYAQQGMFSPVQRAADQAATLGASDDQLADIYKKQLGDRFIDMEKDANGYYVVSFKGDNGEPQKGYVNTPGLDMEDVVRGVRGSLPYMATGGAAGLAGRGLGLAANAAMQGGAAAATSVAGDVGQSPLGSGQGVDPAKAAMAAGLGAAGPVVGRGIANAREVIANRFGQTPQALQPFHRNAVQRTGQALDADAIDNLAYQQQAANLGPEGMLADMGPTSQMAAARIARNPGDGRRIVTGALDRRMEGAQNRIDADVTAALGPRQNVPQEIRQKSQQYNKLAKPHYDTFHRAQIMVTPRIQSLLRRAESIGANAQAQRLMDAEGIALPKGSPDVVSGLQLDYIKRGIDDVANVAKPGSNEQRIFSNLARTLREEVDDILSPGNPTQSPWFQARATAGQGLEGKEAVEEGAKVFTQKRDPHVVADELKDLSLYGQDMYRMGARNDLRQIAGRAGTAYGPNGDTAMRSALSSDFNRENLNQITQNPIAARNLNRRIDAETRFAETNDAAQRNSITPTMQAAENLVPTPRGADFAKDAGKKGVTGHAYEMGLRLADWLLGGKLDARANTIATDMAKMLTAQGQRRDAIADAFIKLRQMRGVNKDKAAQLERALTLATRGAQGPAAGYASGE